MIKGINSRKKEDLPPKAERIEGNQRVGSFGQKRANSRLKVVLKNVPPRILKILLVDFCILVLVLV